MLDQANDSLGLPGLPPWWEDVGGIPGGVEDASYVMTSLDMTSCPKSWCLVYMVPTVKNK